MDRNTVFILGAGFTRAFAENAPLLNWDLTSLLKLLKQKYQKFPAILKVIHSLRIDKENRVNIETLLSRLYSGMPYDGAYLSSGNRSVLYADIYDYLIDTLKTITVDQDKQTVLSQFAKFVIENEITCVTFNYDVVVDQALWEYKKNTAVLSEKYWHPDGGYGFFCRPAEALINDGLEVTKDTTSSWLLKLHGSLNWKIKKGFQKPYPLDALIHDEVWRGPLSITPEDVSIHLEAKPFVVPPILDKSILTEQPVLRVLWENAYKKLSVAKTVVFFGYSLPKTDIAASYLFGETLKYTKRKNIFIVNIKDEEDKKIDAYKELFFNLPKSQFSFDGVLSWVKKNC
jgi:hypothetical protein